ncbi:2371_t:CDS:1, partial [Racocetra persica]
LIELERLRDDMNCARFIELEDLYDANERGSYSCESFWDYETRK